MSLFQAFLRFFRRDEIAQDLAEYCLITALVALLAAGIIWKVSGGLQGTWGSANTTLANTAPAQTTSNPQ